VGVQIGKITDILHYIPTHFPISCPCLRKLSAVNNNHYIDFPKHLGKEERELETEEGAEE